ncbi:hypothetical protein Q6D67_07475 [Haliea sp. E1-2-M8]|uniref:hypothetical protein n=1 Tax=Haliea sp. E1-2-M8 TaxID=3064706 RepID=UPI00271F2EA4|nr:hypothetical protein [Haliea sp. E1-2-M8]MDO8861538.1 hypothetical protein [Haliea sp. E1-2-M8]
MGEKVGTTPLQLRERTIYPNDFPDDKAHLYGTITLRRDDCDTQLYRVNETDIRNGLSISLDCRPGTVTASLESPQESGSRVSSTPISADETMSEKKLRQLRVLQELFDEGIITADEERRIRRRVFGTP